MAETPPAHGGGGFGADAEPSLPYLLEDPSLSEALLSGLGLLDLYRLRHTAGVAKRSVTAYLDGRPSMVVLGGLSIELDDDDVEQPAEISSGVYALRLATMEWYALPPLPTPRFAAASCVLSDGRIVVAGGVRAPGADAIANPSVFVEGGRDMMAQPGREAGTCRWRGRNSQRGSRTDVVEAFDPDTATWEALPPLPRPTAGARACLDADGGRLLVVGGSAGPREFSRDVQVFDLAEKRWLDDEGRGGGGGGGGGGGEGGRAMPPMNGARTEFALARIPGRGIVVVGGTNRYLWPNSPLTAEFFDFDTRRWEVLPSPPPHEYDDPGVVSETEQLGCEGVVLRDGRRVVVYGGLHISAEYQVPRGSGNETSSEDEYESYDDGGSAEGESQVRKSELDCWWDADDSEDEDEEDDYGFGRGYQKRLERPFALNVFDLEEKRWLVEGKKEDKGRAFEGLKRARTGGGLWCAGGDALLTVGGNYEFYGEDGRYPSHGTTEEIYIVDGAEGGRVRLPWKKCLRAGVRGVAAACTVGIDNLHALAQKHGWQDLRVGAKAELHGMKTDSFNGRRGRIVKDIGGGATGRWGVLLEGEQKPIAIRAECIRLI